MINKLRELSESYSELQDKLNELESESIKEVDKYLEGRVRVLSNVLDSDIDIVYLKDALTALSELKADCEGEYLNYNPKDGLVTIDDWKKVAYSNAMKLDKLTAEVGRLRGEVQSWERAYNSLLEH